MPSRPGAGRASPFEPGAGRWQQGLGKVRDTVRQELVARQTAGHLPPAGRRVTVLDAGCGQGTQAIRLARAGFDARLYRNRLGIEGVRADEPEEVRQALEDAGAERVAWYGVRLFTDHWEPADPPDDFSELMAAEEEAGRRDPYRSVAALTHTIAVRRPVD